MQKSLNGHSPENGNAKFTSAAQWRKSREEGYSIILPSNNVAVVRPVPLDQLMLNGRIPDFLTPIAAKSLWDETEATSIAQDPDISKNLILLMNLIVPLAMVNPKVVENPRSGEEEISIEDIDFYDKVAIFNLAIQPSTVLRTFREQQTEHVAALHSSQDDELTP